ncbi:MAG: ABC transporter substrate-binding protein [Deltaproteobacteria bacterium]|nr:ABC transporter substrate-binding protein [Deltaproteobacteria bacterium]
MRLIAPQGPRLVAPQGPRPLAAGLLTLLLLAGWPGLAPATEKLIVGVAGVSGPLAHPVVARDVGLFERQGLNVSLIFFQGGTPLIQSMVAGDVKMAVHGGPEVIQARLAGADTIMVAGYMNTLPYSIVVAKGIAKAEQLRGKRAAVSRFGATSDLAMRYGLQKLGLQPGKDVAILQLGDQTSRFGALSAGSVQATVISPPFDLTARKLGFTILTNMADVGLAYQHEVIGTRDAFTREHPESIRRFLRGFIEGIHYWMTQKEGTQRILARHLRIADPEVLEETYEAYKRLTERKPYPTMAGIQFILDEIARREEASKRPSKARQAKAEQFVDLRFVKELDASGFIDSLYRGR